MAPITLIIDDDPAYARSLVRLVQREGFRAEVASSGEEALERVRDIQPDLILVDMGLPGIDGVEVLKRLKEREPYAVCIVVTAHATVESAVAAMHAGAFDFLSKTAQLEEIQFKLRKGLEVAQLRRSVQFLRDQERRQLSALIGESPAMRKVYQQIEEIAVTPATTVLILGETGTGKELVAHAIHGRSERRDRPLVPVNCTAMPGPLVESELFGHERGAFTSADRAKKGLLDLADGGSLFLDEIGDLELSLQGKLLRVIEERRFKRVGGLKDIEVDVRFMAATNRDLEAMAQLGQFRSDLLYRLNVFQIVLPPLRDRGEDILLLSRHFIQQFNALLNKEVKQLERGAEEALRAFPFPGNVRQLRNLIEQAMIQARGETLPVELMRGLAVGPAPGGSTTSAPQPARSPAESVAPLASLAPPPAPTSEEVSPAQQLVRLRQREEELWREEQGIIQGAITLSGGNKTQAAQRLGISRFSLQRRLRRSGPASD